MITKDQATALTLGAVLHHTSRKDHRGKPTQCRVNGKCKTWARNPERFELPVKYGYFECFRITNTNATDWEVA